VVSYTDGIYTRALNRAFGGRAPRSSNRKFSVLGPIFAVQVQKAADFSVSRGCYAQALLTKPDRSGISTYPQDIHIIFQELIPG